MSRSAADVFSSEAAHRRSGWPPLRLQRLVDATAAGRFTAPIHKVYDGLDQIRQAHTDTESNAATGKLVVRVRHS
jgi:NADPH2:quinone reductase